MFTFFVDLWTISEIYLRSLITKVVSGNEFCLIGELGKGRFLIFLVVFLNNWENGKNREYLQKTIFVYFDFVFLLKFSLRLRKPETFTEYLY